MSSRNKLKRSHHAVSCSRQGLTSQSNKRPYKTLAVAWRVYPASSGFRSMRMIFLLTGSCNVLNLKVCANLSASTPQSCAGYVDEIVMLSPVPSNLANPAGQSLPDGLGVTSCQRKLYFISERSPISKIREVPNCARGHPIRDRYHPHPGADGSSGRGGSVKIKSQGWEIK